MMTSLILCLDGFHNDLLDFCPNLKKLYKNRVSGTLKSTVPTITPSAWASIHTGKEVGSHKISGFLKWDKDFNSSVYTGKDIDHSFFYEYLDKAGFDLFLMNLPFTNPPRIDGDVIQSWLTRGDKIEDFLTPKNLLKKFSSIKQYKYHFDRYSPKGVLKVLQSRTKVLKEVIESEEYDIIIAFLNSTDQIQHMGLHRLMDKKKNSKKEEKVLKTVDKFIKWANNKVKSLHIFSDHGFKVYKKRLGINPWLKRKGYLDHSFGGTQMIGRESPADHKIDLGFLPLLKMIKKSPKISKIAYKTLKILTGIPQIRNLSIDLNLDRRIDVKKSLAFAKEKKESGIYINSKENKNKIIEEIINKLKKEGIQASKSKNLHGIEGSKSFPDIFITSESVFPEKSVGNGKITSWCKGEHDRNGIIILSKKETEPRNIDTQIKNLSPTFLNLFNVNIPEGIEGEPILKNY